MTRAARQVTPLTVRDLAAWCGGAATVDAAGNQGVDLPDGRRADYGWWITPDGGGFTVQDPVTFTRTELEGGDDANTV